MKIEQKAVISRIQIENHLKSAIDQLTPNVIERIDLSVTQDDPKEDTVVVRMKRRLKPLLAAACLGLIMVSGGIYSYQENKVVSIVDIDVNPSLEFSLNRRQKVLNIKAINEDAERIIDKGSFRGKRFDIAVDTVVETMIADGYLKEENSAVLVSVTAINEKVTNKIETAILNGVTDTLQDHQVQAVIYNQKIDLSTELDSLAQEYNISRGKAYFLKEMIEKSDTLTMAEMEDLSNLKISELSEGIYSGVYIISEDVSIIDPDNVDQTVEDELTKNFEEDSSIAETKTIRESEMISANEESEETTEKTNDILVHKGTTNPTVNEEATADNSQSETDEEIIVATPNEASDRKINLFTDDLSERKKNQHSVFSQTENSNEETEQEEIEQDID